MMKFRVIKFPFKFNKLKLLKIFSLVFFTCLIFGYLSFVNRDVLIKIFPALGPGPDQAFVSEVYDKIKANYWDSLSDQKLSELFSLAVGKLEGTQSAKPKNKQEVLSLISKIDKRKDPAKKKEFLVNLTNTVLANLQPFGRSGLYTQKLETQLKNTVNNVNPQKDLYKDLGLPKNASAGAVEEAYNKLPEEKKKDKEIAYAKDTLTNKDSKARYDSGGVEPTIFSKFVTQDIVYLQFKKFSPTSMDEFQKRMESFDKADGPTSLIFDLRGNIGGAIDETAYFLGNFIGVNQYAFDFYHQGSRIPFKTTLDKLPVMKKFKQIVILIDNQTQSSAELMATSLKRYKTGILVGTPTRGWGTVESVFPLEHQIDPSEKYSVFLVHSITLRDDNQPIEGRGVDPNVNIKDADWESRLSSYVKYPEFAYAIKQIISNPD